VSTTLIEENLSTQIELLRSENTSLKEQITFFEQEQERLREMLVKMKKQAFGPKSERWETQEQGKFLLNEAEVESVKPEEEQEDGVDLEKTKIKVAGFTRVRGKRQPLPENLPREIVVVELPVEERVDELGNPLKVIGKEVSEKLTYEPAQIKVTEYHRLRYGRDAGDPVKTAPPIPMIIPKGIATASLVAAIVTAKYADGLPLYRQEEIFLRQNIELSRSSMGRWIVRAALAARPLWNILEERILQSPYVACDETHVQVLKEKDRKAQTKSWMWMRCNPSEKKKIVLFDYDPHRSGEVAKRLLGEYKGILQVDGYGAYNILEKQADLIRIGCNMHGRRGFRVAADGSKKSKSLAEQGLRFYRKLYEIEREAKELSWEERHKLREEKARPIWEEFNEWAKDANKKVPRKSSIGDALHYFLNENEYLMGYLRDGRLEIDNGHAERIIKNFAIGRKNWLFSDTPAGAEASALFYSFVVTAKINGVNPFKALTEIFEQLPIAKTIEDFERIADILMGTKNSA
jgi:transposase